MNRSSASAGMTCDEAAVVLMLHSDGERAGQARRHQQQCEACGLGPLPDDLSGQHVDQITSPALPRPSTIMIAILGAVGALQLVLTAPWLISLDPLGLLGPEVDQAHRVRDGAFSVIIAAAALLAAGRPRWAVPSFIIAALALIVQTAASLADSTLVATGANEAIHLLAILATCLTGLLATRLTALGPRRSQALRMVETTPEE